jgi:hypothetical protein
VWKHLGVLLRYFPLLECVQIRGLPSSKSDTFAFAFSTSYYLSHIYNRATFITNLEVNPIPNSPSPFSKVCAVVIELSMKRGAFVSP